MPERARGRSTAHTSWRGTPARKSWTRRGSRSNSCVGICGIAVSAMPPTFTGDVLRALPRLTQRGSQEFLRTGGAGDANNYPTLVRLSNQLKRQKMATFPFRHDQFRCKLNRFAVPRKSKGVAVLKLLSFNHCRPELGKNRCFPIAKFCGCQRAGRGQLVVEIFHGRLAGGTTPFMRRYSTI